MAGVTEALPLPLAATWLCSNCLGPSRNRTGIVFEKGIHTTSQTGTPPRTSRFSGKEDRHVATGLTPQSRAARAPGRSQ